MSWLKSLFTSNGFFSSRQRGNPRSPNITWASKSIGRTVTRTGVFLKRQIWIWPIVATVLLAVLAFGVRRAIESTMKSNLRSQLQTLLNVQAAMVESWARVQTSNATTLANDPQVREGVYQLLAQSEPGQVPADAKAAVAAQQQLRKRLAPSLSSQGYVGYLIADKTRRIIASSYEDLVGRSDVPEYEGFLSRALEGETVVSPPFASVAVMKDESGRVRTGVPTMFVCAPVRDANFQVVAAVGLRLRPENEFTRIMQLGRIGDTGETYAFDKSGLLVSNSRFDEGLILLGLLPDQPNAHSIVTLQVRDPQGDMTAGYRPNMRRSELPLTRMAADAVAGKSGVDVDGYRDYRGSTVVGAWTWLPKYDIGVATEIDATEAFQPLIILQRTFWALYILLGVSALAIFVFTVIVARLRREAQKAEIEAKQLGQYTLDAKMGAGAMGVVYKGHHAMLRRPTAIKMLDVDKVNDASIQRFEREVQLTCQLNNPNTVAIYDYGRTPEGVFYYAMEFLDGIDLQALVEKYGPQPEPRVIRILTQICGSLYEAHTLGLVHRDIKPANIMLNRRGCDADVVKVLDFGLVKAIDEQKQSGMTAANSLTGTPLYMPPEAIQTPNSVDARSDLYAVGAVGYFLLTGTPVFDATSIVELYQQHVSAVPDLPSQRLGKPVSSELEHAILSCLEKSRTKRPHTARELAQLLARCPTAGLWSVDEAEEWWSKHERGAGTPATLKSAETAAASRVYEQTIITNTAKTS
jgi:eukaryotic-like serine/threonine-protein kinase